MKATIKIAPGIEIDLYDLIQSRLLIQGNSGAGKSGVARVIIEETFGKIPFVVMDIEGEYFTLKQLYGDIVIIGGQHADVPISIELAAKLPAFIIKNLLSVVLDVSDLKMNERIRFAKIFFETLMDLPMEYWLPYFFFLEECHKLAGEQDKYESGPAIKDLMSRGRKRMYCGIPITQRISKLHKDVAAECNNKIIGRTNLDIDMDRAAKELGFSKANDRLRLRDLKTGHFFAYGTSFNPQHVHEIKVREAKTKMPKGATAAKIEIKKPTQKLLTTLSKLHEELKVKQAKPLDPKTPVDNKQLANLQAENQRLKSEVLTLKNQAEDMRYQVIAFSKGIIDIHNIAKVYAGMANGIKLPPASSKKDNQLKETKPVKQWTSIAHSPTGKVVTATSKPSNGKIPTGELALLTACRQYPDGLERHQLTTLCGYKKSSRDVYIGRLKDKGYIDQDGSRIVITNAGIEALGPDYKPLPTGKALQDYWLTNLPTGERAILEVAIRHFPNAVTRDKISEETNYQKSSRDVYIGRMAAREVIRIVGRGEIQAAEFLFD